jgi:hypothetical protein
METLRQILIGVSVCGLTSAMFILIRNQWVFKTRMRILHASRWDGRRHIEYDSLPTYDQMMLQFWNWNGDSFIGKGGK